MLISSGKRSSISLLSGIILSFCLGRKLVNFRRYFNFCVINYNVPFLTSGPSIFSGISRREKRIGSFFMLINFDAKIIARSCSNQGSIIFYPENLEYFKTDNFQKRKALKIFDPITDAVYAPIASTVEHQISVHLFVN